MGNQWRTGGKIVSIRPVEGPWTNIEGYGVPARRGGPSWAVTVLLGAAFVGAIGGLAWVRWPGQAPHGDGSAIEWNAVQAVPTRTPDAEDLLWEARAQGEGRPSTPPDQVRGSGTAVRRAFSYCHSGGGTDCVVDGDTFYIDGEKVRIAGIDAPETHPPRCAYEAKLGNQATEKLHALLNSGTVTMTSIDRDRDVYGRLLRNVAVGGQDVGEAMISAGLAREYGRGRRPWC